MEFALVLTRIDKTNTSLKIRLTKVLLLAEKVFNCLQAGLNLRGETLGLPPSFFPSLSFLLVMARAKASPLVILIMLYVLFSPFFYKNIEGTIIVDILKRVS
jgi:hypothetical protein